MGKHLLLFVVAIFGVCSCLGCDYDYAKADRELFPNIEGRNFKTGEGFPIVEIKKGDMILFKNNNDCFTVIKIQEIIKTHGKTVIKVASDGNDLEIEGELELIDLLNGENPYYQELLICSAVKEYSSEDEIRTALKNNTIVFGKKNYKINSTRYPNGICKIIRLQNAAE